MSGFITVSRRIFGHLFWQEKREFSRFEAWLDMIRRANWQDGTFMRGNTRIALRRGQLFASEREMAQWWGWSQKRVQSFLKLGIEEESLSIAKESVGSLITLCNYDTYNSLGITKESVGNQEGITLESLWNQEGISKVVISNNIKNNKQEIKEETPIPQAGGLDFEKLARKVGRSCAKLMTEGEVGAKLPLEKKPLFLKWLGYRHEKGTDITTTVELAEVLKTWLEKDTAELDAAISKSIGAGWKVLVFDAPKASDKKPVFPNYWKPGIEAQFGLTPEQTNEYYRHLIALGWYKTTEQGRPYWNRPAADTSARTGEASLAQTLKTT